MTHDVAKQSIEIMIGKVSFVVDIKFYRFFFFLKLNFKNRIVNLNGYSVSSVFVEGMGFNFNITKKIIYLFIVSKVFRIILIVTDYNFVQIHFKLNIFWRFNFNISKSMAFVLFIFKVMN